MNKNAMKNSKTVAVMGLKWCVSTCTHTQVEGAILHGVVVGLL